MKRTNYLAAAAFGVIMATIALSSKADTDTIAIETTPTGVYHETTSGNDADVEKWAKAECLKVANPRMEPDLYFACLAALIGSAEGGQ